MARDGSGTYSLPEADFVSSTTISSTAMNSNLDDVATALTNSLAKDGQTDPTADIPMADNKLTGLKTGTALTDALTLGQAQNQVYQWASAAGTANAITLAPTPSISAYAAGQVFRFLATATNTGAVTFAVSGKTAKAIQKCGSALVAGDITSADVVEVVYDGTQFQLISPLRTPVLSDGSIAYAKLSIANKDIAIAKLADGTDGELLTWDTSGVIDTVAVGTAGQVLRSSGAGAKPAMSNSIILKDYSITRSAIGSGGGTRNINIENGNAFTITVSTSTNTLVFQNPSASGQECGFTLYVTNGGSQTINYPASVDWVGGTAPTLTASGLDILVFITINGGTTWFGFDKKDLK